MRSLSIAGASGPTAFCARVESIYRTLREIFNIARDRHVTTSAAADAFATERIGRIGRVRLYWTPGGRGWAKIWGAR